MNKSSHFLGILILIFSILLASCDRRDRPYVVYISANTWLWCERIDIETRVAYECSYAPHDNTDIQEYYLSAEDSWAIEK